VPIGLRTGADVPYAQVNGQELCYEDTGGDGPPIVLSHGFLLDHRVFAPQVDELRDVYRLITWDVRGTGGTRIDGAPFTLWDAARDLFGLLDLLGIERAVLVGMDQGGSLSLRGALLHPDRVRALILVGTQAPPEAPDRIAEYRAMVDAWTEHGYDEELASAMAERVLGEPGLAEEWKPRWRELDPALLGLAADDLLDRDDVTERLPELAMPVLCVHGTEDTAVPVARAHEICAAVDDCRGVVEVAGAPHAVHLTHAQVVDPAIRAFLEDLPA
jgi:3-oxoadipate enol-lactonase